MLLMGLLVFAGGESQAQHGIFGPTTTTAAKTRTETMGPPQAPADLGEPYSAALDTGLLTPVEAPVHLPSRCCGAFGRRTGRM
jgi:hypothetical protein